MTEIVTTIDDPINVIGAHFTPEVGLRGTYLLKTPFDKIISETIYTCTGNERISKLIGSGVDVYNDFYVKFGLTADDYDRDVAQNRSIITLISDAGTTAAFPVGYLAAYPNMNGVVYMRYILQAGLPLMPVDTDFTMLEEQVRSLILKHIGANSVTDVVEASEQKLVAFDVHEANQAKRNVNKDIPMPLNLAEQWRLRYEAKAAELESLIRYVESLKP